jgi:chromosome segregation ATPase
MKGRIASIATLALVFGFGAGLAAAQNSTSSESLVDVARQLKAQRAKSQEKPKVFTNDDLAALPPLPATSRAAAPEAKPSKETSGKEAKQESASATLAGTDQEPHGEKYFREHMGELEARLGLDERELNVLQQKLQLSELMYYPDPNKGLLQESGPTAMADVHKLQDEVTKKEADIAADQDAIEGLREQLRRDGGDAGWLRNVPARKASEGQAEEPKFKKGTKEYWQARFQSARARLADARERQQLAEDELNLLQIQDARELNSNLKADLDAKIKPKEDEVSQNRVATEEAQKALDDLRKEFQASGAPEEWSQE